jgi:hypothetical protein
MICEKHSGRMADWTTDAALGQLRPAQEAELLAHVGECDACREAYRHAREVAATVDRGVEALVAGEPSPYFAARFRARVAAERITPRSNWMVWVPVAAGVLAAGALLLIVMIRSPQQQAPSAALVVAPTIPSNPLGGTETFHAPVPARDFLQGTASASTRYAKGSRAFNSEILVPPGQLAAAMQLRDAVYRGHVDGEQLAAAETQIAKPLEVQPIEIAPLESSDADAEGNEPTRF